MSKPVEPTRADVEKLLTRYEGMVATYEDRLSRHDISIAQFHNDLEHAKEDFTKAIMKLLEQQDMFARVDERKTLAPKLTTAFLHDVSRLNKTEE